MVVVMPAVVVLALVVGVALLVGVAVPLLEASLLGVNGRELEDTLPPPTPLQNTQLPKSTSSDKRLYRSILAWTLICTFPFQWTNTVYYPYLCSLSPLPLHTDPLKSTDMASSCFV
eukprot:Em0014g160a